MSGPGRLSVVVAVKEADRNVADILTRLAPSRHPDVQFIFCVAGEVPPPLRAIAANVHIVGAPRGQLVPHLWRDGIRAATGERVAITTAQCVPPADWVDQMGTAGLSRHVGLGGPISNDADSTAAQWAIFFLRYLPFARLQVARDVPEIAADNAIYRRPDILRHLDLLEIGFWEPSFHARFRADGLKLRLVPELATVHRGCGSPLGFISHRFQHGRQFGQARAEGLGTVRRLAFLLASPLVPVILTGRIVRGAAGHAAYRRHFLAALPWLMLFIAAWSVGEAAGYAQALFQPRK